MKRVIIHSDGGCEGNPGPGGWAAVLEYGAHLKEVSGGELATTNNRMELQAAISGLRMLKERCSIAFHTDSEYVRNGITRWIARWKVQGWRTTDKKPVRNEDLWRQLDELAARHEIQWIWLKGHAGHTLNERCDQLAGSEIEKIRSQFSPVEIASALKAFVEARAAAPAQPQWFG